MINVSNFKQLRSAFFFKGDVGLFCFIYARKPEKCKMD